jgi:hypothetical protein
MMLEAEQNAAERKQLDFLSRGADIEPPQPEYVCGRSVEAD